MSNRNPRHYQATVASLSRTLPADHPRIVEAKTEMRTWQVIEHIERVLAQAPPLTPAQVDRIAAVLRPTR